MQRCIHLSVDAASLAMLGVGGSSDDPALFLMGLAGYQLGAPIVHWAHGDVGAGFGSLALRAVTPVLASIWLGSCFQVFETSSSPTCEVLSASVLASVPLAIVIDAAFLAWEPARDKSFRVTTWVDAGRGGGISFAGRLRLTERRHGRTSSHVPVLIVP